MRRKFFINGMIYKKKTSNTARNNRTFNSISISLKRIQVFQSHARQFFHYLYTHDNQFFSFLLDSLY